MEIIDELPRTDSGKVKKYLLVEDIKKRMRGRSPAADLGLMWTTAKARGKAERGKEG